jgi:hypothetical protein
MTRILLTTVNRDQGLYDYFRENAPTNFRWRFQMPRQISFGLRFLHQNIPEVEILEYPTLAEYRCALKKGWDAVGFSFYIEESNRILAMADDARGAGVQNLWAGNYGALTPSLRDSFTQVFQGYSEDAVAQAVGRTIDKIEHPPLVTQFCLPGGWPLPIGVLFTTRGCSFTCTFCQTTAFAPKPKAIPLESIERVLRFYVEHGIHYVLILDENFGNIPQQAEAVINLLARHKLHWFVQSRVDLFLRNFDEWLAKGLEGALFGIESFHQEVLKQIHKGEKVEAVMELAARLNRAGKYAQGYYIIGFPSETPESIRGDLKLLASLELDVTQITIVTPHPCTALWTEYESKYGIFEKDWSKFDTKHLVWGHPNCAPGTLESLLEEGFAACYEKPWLRRTVRKFVKSRLRSGDLTDVLWSPLHARWATPSRLPYLTAR